MLTERRPVAGVDSTECNVHRGNPPLLHPGRRRQEPRHKSIENGGRGAGPARRRAPAGRDVKKGCVSFRQVFSFAQSSSEGKIVDSNPLELYKPFSHVCSALRRRPAALPPGCGRLRNRNRRWHGRVFLHPQRGGLLGVRHVSDDAVPLELRGRAGARAVVVLVLTIDGSGKTQRFWCQMPHPKLINVPADDTRTREPRRDPLRPPLSDALLGALSLLTPALQAACKAAPPNNNEPS